MRIDNIGRIVQCTLKDSSTDLVEKVFQQFRGK